METFNKSERLCSLKLIEELFKNGENLNSPLFKIIWMKSPVELIYPAQAAISVPKKNFRKAVDRNLLRRRIREAYRKNKQDLYKELASLELQLVFIMIFRGNNIADYSKIEQSIREMIILLKGRITKKLKKY